MEGLLTQCLLAELADAAGLGPAGGKDTMGVQVSQRQFQATGEIRSIQLNLASGTERERDKPDEAIASRKQQSRAW